MSSCLDFISQRLLLGWRTDFSLQRHWIILSISFNTEQKKKKVKAGDYDNEAVSGRRSHGAYVSQLCLWEKRELKVQVAINNQKTTISLPLFPLCPSFHVCFPHSLPHALLISVSMWKAAGFVTCRPSSVSHMRAKHMLECNLFSQPRAKKKDH